MDFVNENSFVSHLVFGQQLLDTINEMDSRCPELEEFQNVDLEIIDFGSQWYIGKKPRAR